MICSDSREIHPHICGACGGWQMFTKLICERLSFSPPCYWCGNTYLIQLDPKAALSEETLDILETGLEEADTWRGPEVNMEFIDAHLGFARDNYTFDQKKG